MTDREWMQVSLRLAERGTGKVSPNPRVGCVIVDHDGIIAEGWHERYGGPHAEAHALSNLTRPLTPDAVLYVTLEPCSHHGKTPPCADAIIASGIKNVVVGMIDPNPLVGGNGIRRLQEHGINVRVDVERDACAWLNRTFTHYITRRTPYVVMKIASTIDGMIAPEPVSRMQLTGEGSHRVVHLLRSEFDAVMVSARTVAVDDPTLNVRAVEGRDPIRVVLDRTASLSLDSTIVKTSAHQRTIIYAATDAEASEHADALRGRGIEIRTADVDHAGTLDIAAVLDDLGTLGISSILVEPGPGLASAMLKGGWVNELRVHYSPTLIGAGRGITGTFDKDVWKLHAVESLQNDVLITYVAASL